MNVAIFGSATATGRALVDAALDDGHAVTILESEQRTFPYTHERLRVVEGDVFDVPSVETAMRGADAVVTAFGESLDRIPGTDCRDAMENVLAALSRFQLSRLIAVTDGDQSRLRERITRLFDRSEDDDDREAQATLVEASDAAWTVVVPTRVTDGAAAGNYRAGPAVDRDGAPLSRADLAAFVLDVLDDDAYVRTTVTVAGASSA